LYTCFSKKTSFLPYAIVKEPTLTGPPSSCLVRNKNFTFLLLSSTS